MGLFNTLYVTLACPHCKKEYEAKLQFKAGECWQYDYKIGDTILIDPKDPEVADLEIVADAIVEGSPPNPIRCPICGLENPEDYDIFIRKGTIVGIEIQSEASRNRLFDEFYGKSNGKPTYKDYYIKSSMPKKLNRQSVSTQKRPIKILQFGEGNFLRAFCDWMVDILNEKTDFNGNVQIVQPIAQGMGAMINSQDGLYHVVLNGKYSKEDRLITCVDSVVNPYDDYKKFLALAENSDLEFVFSNTTEAGIAFNENDKSYDVLPESFPGKVTALLLHRYNTVKKRLTFLPCELIEKNGSTLKSVVYQYIDLWKLPGDFKDWVNAEVYFCNTLVDRIVPGFPKETIQEIHDRTGYEDNLAVMAEPFHLWVIEAPAHVRALLPLEKAGLQVKFVPDLTPYRTRKVRILNGAHTTLVPVAYLKGLRTVRESVDDQEVGDYLLNAIHEEIIPTLDLPKEELVRFADEVIERFQNPFIKHELASIALNSISKYKVRVLPSVLGYIALKKELPKRLLYSLAALIKFYKGEGRPVNDTPEIIEFFKKAWATNDPVHAARLVLGNKDLWGQDLNEIEGLTKLVTEDLKALELTS